MNKVVFFVGALCVAVVILMSQFMYVLPVHIASFVVTITAVIVADLNALLWVIGKLPTLPYRRMVVLHYIVSIGLLVSITSGILMFLPLKEELLSMDVFRVKMIFVAALVINSFVIMRHLFVSTTHTFSSLTPDKRNILLISGFVSSMSWAGAFIAALFLGV